MALGDVHRADLAPQINPVHELDPRGGHEKEIVLWDIQYHGTGGTRFCFLRRCAFKYVGPERVHWLEKRYRVYGLEGKEFWVDGEKANPLYELPEM
jgi:phage-related protein